MALEIRKVAVSGNSEALNSSVADREQLEPHPGPPDREWEGGFQKGQPMTVPSDGNKEEQMDAHSTASITLQRRFMLKCPHLPAMMIAVPLPVRYSVLSDNSLVPNGILYAIQLLP